jgi:predicted aconitase with swiveling domain
MSRLMGTAPAAMVFTTMNTKIALGVVVTRVPAITDLDADPLTTIRTGDWVRVDADHGELTVTRADG